MSDDEVPPPYSEQELDQKIAQALVISAQPHQTPQQGLTDDGEWEQWDEAVFAAAEARRNGIAIDSNLGASGSQTYERHESYNASLPVPGAVQPLRIHKRGGSSVSGATGSWMGDVISEDSYGSSSSGHALRNEHRRRHDIPPDSYDDGSIPPPPFTSVDARIDRLARLEYHPESTPPSPLNSPPNHHLPLPPDPHLALTGQNQFLANVSSPPHPVHFSPPPGTAQRPPRQSLPIAPRSPNYHLQQRPASAIHPYQNPASSHSVINHSTHSPHTLDRLGQHAKSIHPLTQTQSPPHDVYLSGCKKTAQPLPSQGQSFTASALYHSSVSGHLSSPMSMQPRMSHSSRQPRSPQISQPQSPQHNTLHMADQASSSAALPLGATSANYLANQSMPNIHAQGSSPSQHPTNATYFPQYPTFTTQHGDPTIPRWATSEQQLNQNFQ